MLILRSAGYWLTVSSCHYCGGVAAHGMCGQPQQGRVGGVRGGLGDSKDCSLRVEMVVGFGLQEA
jgi:hypothetical protein